MQNQLQERMLLCPPVILHWIFFPGGTTIHEARGSYINVEGPGVQLTGIRFLLRISVIEISPSLIHQPFLFQGEARSVVLTLPRRYSVFSPNESWLN